MQEITLKDIFEMAYQFLGASLFIIFFFLGNDIAKEYVLMVGGLIFMTRLSWVISKDILELKKKEIKWE